MDSCLYNNDIESQPNNIDRFTKMEDSLNRTLMSTSEKNVTKYTYNYCCYTFLMYAFIGLIMVMLIVSLIFIIKHI